MANKKSAHINCTHADSKVARAACRRATGKRTPYERFMLKVDTTGQCWLWKGSDNGRGYGRFSVDGKTYQQAARWLLGHLRGKPLESHEWACHHCDNPRCVRADHLYVGDSESNARDMAERGRAKNGNSAKTHCPKGHPYDEENTYRWGNHRACRTCQRVT